MLTKQLMKKILEDPEYKQICRERPQFKEEADWDKSLIKKLIIDLLL